MDRNYLLECVTYNPEAGSFTWMRRPRDHFRSDRDWNAWNARFSGKETGNMDGRGYIQIKINRRKYLAHRLAYLLMTGEDSPFVDHIDGDKQNNRFDNIRSCNRSQNCGNTRVRSTNKAGLKGVSQRGGKWVATIRRDGTQVHLGTFETSEEAAMAYDSAALLTFGCYAKTNSAMGLI